MRLYGDVEAASGEKFRASGQDAEGLSGSNDGVSSWQWFPSDDRTVFVGGAFPVSEENESIGCRTGGYDRERVDRVAR